MAPSPALLRLTFSTRNCSPVAHTEVQTTTPFVACSRARQRCCVQPCNAGWLLPVGAQLWVSSPAAAAAAPLGWQQHWLPTAVAAASTRRGCATGAPMPATRTPAARQRRRRRLRRWSKAATKPSLPNQRQRQQREQLPPLPRGERTRWRQGAATGRRLWGSCRPTPL